MKIRRVFSFFRQLKRRNEKPTSFECSRSWTAGASLHGKDEDDNDSDELDYFNFSMSDENGGAPAALTASGGAAAAASSGAARNQCSVQVRRCGRGQREWVKGEQGRRAKGEGRREKGKGRRAKGKGAPCEGKG